MEIHKTSILTLPPVKTFSLLHGKSSSLPGGGGSESASKVCKQQEG